LNPTALGRIGFVAYLALYLCPFVPAHAAYETDCHPADSHYGQTEEHCLTHEHDAGSCPTCQIANGLIDLPVRGFSFVNPSQVQPLSKAGQSHYLVFAPTKATSRAPPVPV
jgi:hypothetical protein